MLPVLSFDAPTLTPVSLNNKAYKLFQSWFCNVLHAKKSIFET